MALYRRKYLPVVAIQWTGQNLDQIRSLVGYSTEVVKEPSRDYIFLDCKGVVQEPERPYRVVVPLNYWVVMDKGYVSAFPPDVFDVMYELADNNLVAEGSPDTAV